MFYHKDCNLPVALRSEQGEELIHVLVVIQIQVLLIFLVICYWIYLHVSESRSEHSCITHPFWQNSQFSTFEVVLRMAFWSEDFYGKKGPLFTTPLIMASCGGDGRWQMSEENGAGPRLFVGHAAMWIYRIMMQEKRRHCITICSVHCDFSENQRTTNKDGVIVDTEDCEALLLMMHSKRDWKLVRWGF